MDDNDTSLGSIKHGSVIDHIPAGQALRIVSLLQLQTYDDRVCLAMRLPSPSLGRKDLIKIEGWQLYPDEASRVAILAPEATVNIIDNHQVQRKFSVTLPDSIEQILACPNPCCVTNSEQCCTLFSTKVVRSEVLLECHHCRGLYLHQEIERYNL